MFFGSMPNMLNMQLASRKSDMLEAPLHNAHWSQVSWFLLKIRMKAWQLVSHVHIKSQGYMNYI